jgi:hypothetical protein
MAAMIDAIFIGGQMRRIIEVHVVGRGLEDDCYFDDRGGLRADVFQDGVIRENDPLIILRGRPILSRKPV